jgi:poly(hydroxyalkanoate) granule-associated protein
VTIAVAQEGIRIMGETSRVIVERWLSAVVSGNAAGAADATTPDVRLHGIGAPVSGPAAVDFVLGSLRAAFPDLQVEKDVLTAEGPWVVVRFTAKGTQQTPLFGLRPGDTREASGVCCFSVGEQGITDVWLYADAGQLLQQFDLRPAQSVAAGAESTEQESWPERVAENARDIWLAGLGALSAAGEHGERLFHALIDQGRKLESSVRQGAAAAETVEGKGPGITERARQVASTGQEYIRDVATNIRGRLDLPTRDEFEELRRKVDELMARVESITPPTNVTS